MRNVTRILGTIHRGVSTTPHNLGTVSSTPHNLSTSTHRVVSSNRARHLISNPHTSVRGHVTSTNDHVTGPLVEVFTSDTCTLCGEVLLELQDLQRSYTFSIKEVKIKPDNTWYKKYKYDIPVIHVDGVYLCKHRLDRERLCGRLTQ